MEPNPSSKHTNIKNRDTYKDSLNQYFSIGEA